MLKVPLVTIVADAALQSEPAAGRGMRTWARRPLASDYG